MSDRLFMSYSYFSRNFKRVTGRCFKDFLNITRINNAEMKLRSTTKSVTQIAMECGYNNIAYFSAMYKKLKGVSPTSARDTQNPD
jgi:AraC-like DNA-binding protein